MSTSPSNRRSIARQWSRCYAPAARSLLERICEVVHTAHEQGIVHQDLKPENVMVISRAGRLLPKLLDFGIAHTIADTQPRAGEPELRGSPPYMAPDRVDRSERIRPRLRSVRARRARARSRTRR